MSIREKGFSLPEIMIALGLLAGISLVTVKVIENQANNEANLKAQAEIQKTVALLKAVLNNPASCRDMLKGQVLDSNLGGSPPLQDGVSNIGLPPVLPPPATNPTKPGLYQNINNKSYREILAVGSNYGRFRLAPPTASPVWSPIQLIKVTHSNTNVDAIDLSIQFNVETKSIIFRDDGDYSNDRTYRQRIPLLVTFDPTTRQITDCGLVISDAAEAAKMKLCESMGNMTEWDPLLGKCKFITRECTGSTIPHQQMRSDDDADPVFTCVDIHTKFNVMQIFDTVDGGVTRRCQSGTGTYNIIAYPDADDSVDPGRVKLRINCM